MRTFVHAVSWCYFVAACVMFTFAGLLVSGVDQPDRVSEVTLLVGYGLVMVVLGAERHRKSRQAAAHSYTFSEVQTAMRLVGIEVTLEQVEDLAVLLCPDET